MANHNTNQSSGSAFTFFAILAYTIAVFLLVAFVVGSMSFAANWWLMLLMVAVGVGFTGTAIREGREEETTAMVASPLIEEAAPEEAKKKPAAPQAKQPTSTKKATATDKPDDLTKIEGIGPKTSKALIAQGIATYAALAQASIDDIRAALDAEGVRFAPSAESWAEQAGYAAKGDWDGLQALQDTLEAGRYPS